MKRALAALVTALAVVATVGVFVPRRPVLSLACQVKRESPLCLWEW